MTVVTRTAYGGGYAVMGSKHLGADVDLAWPTAEIAVMGAEGDVRILHRRELAAVTETGRDEVERRLLGNYREHHAGVYSAADRGHVDAVIMPAETRIHVGQAFQALRNKRKFLPAKKHGNIPL